MGLGCSNGFKGLGCLGNDFEVLACCLSEQLISDGLIERLLFRLKGIAPKTHKA